MQQIYRLPLVLEPQPEGGYTITCPLIPELITEADTLDDVIPNVTDALEVVKEIFEDEGRQLSDILQPLTPNLPIVTDILLPVTNE
jgi:antitoxin HicB